MKTQQLLQAIGYADEQFLEEAEAVPSGGRVRFYTIAIVAAIVAVVTVSVLASENLLGGLLKPKDNGSAVSNLSTGMGSFAYTEEGIYYGVPGVIYLCDFDGNVQRTYPLSDAVESPRYLFATEDAIIYVNSTGVNTESDDEAAPIRDHGWELRMQPKDGSAPISICPGIAATAAYADGDQLYVTNGGDMLTRINLLTLEQTELLENVQEYFVDDTYIYAVKSGTDYCYYRSSKDVIAFEKITLQFDPNKVIAAGEDLYFCRWLEEEEQAQAGRRYQVNLVRSGTVTPLPVYSWLYQVLDGAVLYIEETTNLLKCFHADTGETKTLEEDVFAFTILNERYICIERYGADPIVYDWQSESSSEIRINR